MLKALAPLCAVAALALPTAALAEPMHEFIGSMHEHSAYSDGWPGTRPADVFDSISGYGLDFGGISDHSDNTALPLTLSEACYGQGRGEQGTFNPLDPSTYATIHAPECVMADQVNPQDSLRKWDATAEQAASATTPGFTAFRGFEWSSNRFGHLNVFFSSNWTGAYDDGGFVDMGTFWSWFERPATLGGGSDGLGTFNHPGAKKIDSVPGLNWNDFAYQAAADERMVGIEVFNDTDEYGTLRDSDLVPEGYYAHALDKGWHLGAIGAEDLGHRQPPLDNWGGPQWAKTVIIAPTRSAADLKAALLARRFYAVGPNENGLRVSFDVDGQRMGSRLQRPTRTPLSIRATVNDPALVLELVTSGGKVVAHRAGGTLTARRPAGPGEKWYFVRARRGDRPVAYSSPVWVDAVTGGGSGTWLAGDMHVHTCYSHDVYCGPTDDNTGPDTAYSSFGTVAERFTEAAAKGLDFINVSDHNDVRAWSDPDFGSHGVVGLHGYEASLAGGHAHVVGVNRMYDRGPDTTHGEAAASARAMAGAIEADGGLFQANHPAYRIGELPRSCADADLSHWDTDRMFWKYGFDVVPDSIEVWNPTTLIAPSELYWECWLQRGVHMPATAGSDTHGAQGQVGTPMTWVFSRSRSERSIVAAIAAGRTTLSRLAPSLGGLRLLLEGDGKRRGAWDAMVGDTVAPGTTMRVRAEGLPATGLVTVRANGRTIVDGRRLDAGGTIEFKTPDEPGWVRAELSLPEPLMSADPGCTPNPSPVSLCSHDFAVASLTSPIYLGRPAEGAPPPHTDPPQPGRDAGPGTTGTDPAIQAGDAHEPDSEAPMAPGPQSHGASALPTVATSRRPRVRLHIVRSGRHCAATFGPAGQRYDVQERVRSHWRTRARGTQALRLVLRSCRDAVRVRATAAPGASAAAWMTRSSLQAVRRRGRP